MRRGLPSLILTFVVLVTIHAEAASLPQTIIESERQRDQSLSHLAFDWAITFSQSDTGASPAEVANAKKTLAANARAQFQKMGKTGAELDRLVQLRVQGAAAGLEPVSWGFSETWQFTRNGDSTAIVGTKKLGPAVTAKEKEYYIKDVGMRAETQAQTDGKAAKSKTTTNIWGCSDNAASIREPFQDGLHLGPEDFVMLVGSNPLKMYGAQWRLVSTTPDAYILEGSSEHDNFRPLTIKLTLSRLHDNVPSDIQIHGSGGEEVEYQANNFARQGHTWICTRAQFMENFQDTQVRKQAWVLRHVKPSLPIVLSLPKGTPVNDFRLVGKDLMTSNILRVWTKHDPNLVQYSWPGHIPTEAELRAIHKNYHPGEATPDPGKSSSVQPLLPFLGGMFCLVGGVWMFKRRGMA